MNENEIAEIIVNLGMKVHRILGPGLFEAVYETCLTYELEKAGLHVERQVALPVYYEGVRMDLGYRIDLMVNGKVIVELKAVDYLVPVHKAQLLTYLRFSGCKLGLLLNFNLPLFKDGINRVINGQIM